MRINGIVYLLTLLICFPAIAAPTLNLGPATASGTSVSFPVTLTNVQGTSISAIEADIIFNRTSDVFAIKTSNGYPVSATIGAAAVAAGKQISQSSPMDGILHIVVISFGNTTPIPDGVVAQISFDIISAASSSTESFAIVPSATDPTGIPETISGTGTPAPATGQLAVTLTGNGVGSVNSVPSGIACIGGSCSANFYLDSLVTLMHAASTSSSFVSWSGDCAGSGNCAVSMGVNRSATASFLMNNTVRVGAIDYGTLVEAYAKAPQESLIKAVGVTFFENLDMNRGIAVTFKGGYDSTFNNLVGYSTIDGALTISTGSFTPDRLIVQ
ncbi:MAG: hypothetical protein A2X82_04195 [Geobacteraceae bacterium GWC2_55_20]|nr:MAG: hypothetical protein A2X82_04195 [Geobacteraceae bacterium GWC2_55_20]HCE68757.1 hypothetical protein [Geobacter sp.]